MDARRDATPHTKAKNDALLGELPFEDRQDFEDASRGFVAPLPDGGRSSTPRTAGPSATRRSSTSSRRAPTRPTRSTRASGASRSSCCKGGLFKVVDRLYQVRNADISNLTVIEGDTGLILMDPLISAETASQPRSTSTSSTGRRRPVVAVIHSHSHVDHYGGVKGVRRRGRRAAPAESRIIAPIGFLEAAVVRERAGRQRDDPPRRCTSTGRCCRPTPRARSASGSASASRPAPITLIPPTDEITETGQKMVIDGLTFEFLLAPDTEAPAEMHWFIEELSALTAAENCCHTLHNTYTLRGAPDPRPAGVVAVPQRDDRPLGRQDRGDVRHAPLAGVGQRSVLAEMLRKGRDAYRYINDQTLRLANHGYTPGRDRRA